MLRLGTRAVAKPTETDTPNADLAFVARMLGRILLFGALGLALNLGVISLMQGTVAGCGEGGSCESVMASKWGYALGVPVGLLGAMAYIALLGSELKGCCPQLHAVCRWTILGAAAWFVCVQVFISGQFCAWCCVTHTLAVLGVLLLWKSPPRGSDNLAGHRYFAPGLGLIALAGLIVLQALGPDRPTTAGGSLAEGQGASVSGATDDGPRTVSLHGGKFVIDVQDFPAIGDARRAEHVAVGLFDFTCPHCRELAEILTTVQKEFGDRLAVVQLPGHFNGKGETIQRLLLAVWREDPDTYHAVAKLLHEGTLAASEAEVRAAIAAHVDANVHQSWLDKHAAWIREVLADSRAIREKNRSLIGTGKFPQLMIGDYVEAGTRESLGHYYGLFKEKFGLARTTVPKLEVEPKAIALGTLYAGATQSFRLRLKNPGGLTVHLARPQLPRGMRARFSRPKELSQAKEFSPKELSRTKELAAGEETTLEIDAIFSTPGPFKSEIAIRSDAEPAMMKIPIEAKVIRPYLASPEIADLGTFRGQPLSGKIDLTFVSPVKPGVARLSKPREFKITMAEIARGKRYELTITAAPNPKRAGLHYTNIFIPVQPLEAIHPWPRQIRLTARCQVPSKTPRSKGATTRRLPGKPAAPPRPAAGANGSRRQ